MKIPAIDFSNIKSEATDNETLERQYLHQLGERERRELGQVFTPHYIIRFILHHLITLTTLEEFPSSFELKILDPACGLGRFLVESYNFLEKKMGQKGWDEKEIYEVLVGRCLYGMDIEPMAVDFTRKILYFKKKNGQNIYSLIFQSNILSSAPIEKEFDIILGNPPYFLISLSKKGAVKGKQFHTTNLTKELIEKYRSIYKSWPKNNQNPNIFYLFIERGIELLREGGELGFIIPDILLSGDSTENLRRVILATCCIKKILIIEGVVFKDRGISNIIIILQKCGTKEIREKNMVEIINTSTFELRENDTKENYYIFDIPPHRIPQSIFYETPHYNFATRMTKESSKVFQNIFGKLKAGKILKLGAIIEIQRGIENLRRQDALELEMKREKTHYKLITATNIEKYRINWNAALFAHKWVDYNPRNPAYTNIEFKKKEWFLQQKIVLKRVSTRLIAAFDDGGNNSDFYFALDSVQMLWMKEEFRDKIDLRVILAILNSDFMNFYYQTLFSYKKLFARVQKIFLFELPIPSEISKEVQAQICDYVDQLRNKHNLEVEKQLNQLIFKLFFTKDELLQFQNAFDSPKTLRDLPGIGINRYWELRNNNIKTLEDLLECDIVKIANSLKGIGKKSLKKWKREAMKLLESEK
ncbi:MAG: N-6 DNA methylase [Candidatus Helarchaeota archaeon]